MIFTRAGREATHSNGRNPVLKQMGHPWCIGCYMYGVESRVLLAQSCLNLHNLLRLLNALP